MSKNKPQSATPIELITNSVLIMPVAIYWTRFPDDASIGAGSHMGYRYGSWSDSAGLHSQHTTIQVRPTVGSTHQILLRRAPMIAGGSLGPLAPILVLGHAVRGALCTGLLLHFANVGID